MLRSRNFYNYLPLYLCVQLTVERFVESELVLKVHCIFIGSAVLRAIKATKEVMKGATPVAGEVNSIFYTKAGDFSQAMKDFDKFAPDDIHGFNPSKGVRYLK